MTYLSDRQLAERYGVNALTIWRWHREDPSFPRAVKLGKATTRWKLAEVEAWEKSRAVAA